ncbi:UNVERIFIED_CONTAM: hypothetical protein Slati_2152100 [Sesamum latifolium]|uniref:Uncharacterized protein n=1 Tax=Sesamum latifolium TaxID=2727402 RepID=A0AAW2WR64_9LAMI
MPKDQLAQTIANGQHLPTSFEASTGVIEQQLWMSAFGTQNKGRVFGLDSEAHNPAAGPSLLSRTHTLSKPPVRPDIDDPISKLEEMFMHVMINLPIPPFPDRSEPLASRSAPHDNAQDDVDCFANGEK